MSIENKTAKVLEVLAKKGFYDFPSLYEDIFGMGKYREEFHDHVVIKDALLSEDLVTMKNSNTLYIKSKGRKVIDSPGGYIEYLKKKREEEDKERKHKNRQRAMTKWKVWFFWPLLGIAVLGAIGNAEKSWATIQKILNKAIDVEKVNELEAKPPIPQLEIDSIKVK